MTEIILPETTLVLVTLLFSFWYSLQIKAWYALFPILGFEIILNLYAFNELEAFTVWVFMLYNSLLLVTVMRIWDDLT